MTSRDLVLVALQRPLRRQTMPLGFEVRNGSATLQVRAVCNLYSITKNQAAIRDLLKVTRDSAGNRHAERVFNPSRKDPHWGRRKLSRDQ